MCDKLGFIVSLDLTVRFCILDPEEIICERL